MPYARAYENGQVIRVETDGSGGLVDIVESSTGDMLYGESRGKWRQLRAAAPKNPPIAYGNLARVCRRMGMEQRVLAYLHKYHSDGSTGARYGLLAERVGTSKRNISNIMLRLQVQGYAIVRYGREQNSHGGYRKISHWHATDTWAEHLPHSLEKMIRTKPMSASQAAQLLGINYEYVVKALAELAADGLLDRKRVGPGYVYMEHADLEIGGW